MDSRINVKFIDGYSLCPSPPGSSTTMGAELPLEPHKLVVVIIFLLCAGISNWAALAYIHDFVGRDALPDIVFSVVPEQLWALEVGDLMVTFSAASIVLLFAFHKYRVVVMRRILFIIGVLYTFRTLSMLFTQLPSGYNDNEYRCRRQLNGTERTLKVYMLRILEQTIHVGFQDIENKMLCGDLLYSGHTLIMVVASLTVSHYMPSTCRYLRHIPKAFMLLGMTCMIISRTHYTIDVFFAYCFSAGVFTLYHAFCEIDTYRERKNSILHQLLLTSVVAWLEENVIPGRIENKLEVPLVQAIYRKFTDPSSMSNKTRQPNNSMSPSSSVVMEPA